MKTCAYCSMPVEDDAPRITSPGKDHGKPLCDDCVYWCDGNVLPVPACQHCEPVAS
jgi:hypothetical protein